MLELNYDKAMAFKLIQSSIDELTLNSSNCGKVFIKAVLGHKIARK
jgi:hypothetical protein